jgi:2-polyprenyl-6-methoxyphenol hydroxylase-like FAD-dependent oxidoreductase
LARITRVGEVNVTGRAIISGGSIGGLFAACVLLRAGWQVDVYERTGVELAGRGAGIVTHEPLIAALEAVGANTKDLGVLVNERVAYDRVGDRVRTLEYPQVVTSWDRMHRVLREIIPDESYHLGRAIVGYQEAVDGVTAVFEDGRTEQADLLIAADGFRSAIRSQMLPEVKPDYAGYVVWRALANEAEFPKEVHRQVFDTFGFFIPNGTQIIGYPIAGPDNDLRPGHLRYNFVWYARVPQGDLDDMLTDASGQRHEISIPPPLVRKDVLQRMEQDAATRLPAPFVEILKISERPFFTPIYDHHSPVMGQGHVALAGDAACVARPHVGMGVTKAALDALALARHLQHGTIPEALTAYSDERVTASRVAYDRSQRLGGLIFDGPDDVNRDGRSHPDIETVMRDTAVVI